jgi:AcrR family transcriptional regulator
MASGADTNQATPSSEPLSRGALIEVAVAIARSEGLGALTMRRLAVATGKAPMTLYSHIPNKDGLLVLVADALLGEIEVPQGRWDQALKELSLSTWRTMGETAGLAHFVWRHVPYFFTPQGLRLADGSMGLLIDAGFGPDDARRAQEALMTYITGDVQRHEAWLAAGGGPVARKVKGYPNLEAVSTHNLGRRRSGADTEETFVYGLELLLEGLRRDPRRRRRRAAAPRRQGRLP